MENGIALCWKDHDAVHRGFLTDAATDLKIECSKGLLYEILRIVHGIVPTIETTEFQKEWAAYFVETYTIGDRTPEEFIARYSV